MKVFQLDEYDWWAGATLAECIATARATFGAGSYCEAEEVGCEVSAERMQTLTFLDDDADPPQTYTFAQQLAREVADGGAFPRFFASTET